MSKSLIEEMLEKAGKTSTEIQKLTAQHSALKNAASLCRLRKDPFNFATAFKYQLVVEAKLKKLDPDFEPEFSKESLVNYLQLLDKCLSQARADHTKMVQILNDMD